MTYYSRVFATLLGRKTWVSYDKSVNVGDLPKLNDGVFVTSQESGMIEMTESVRKRINYFYAKNYNVMDDIGIIFRNLLKR